MRRCVIVGAAPIADYARCRAALRPDDFFLFCDGGLRHAAGLGVSPDLIVGDFDSHPRPDTDGEIIVLPREKDDTDTVFAAKEALRRGFGEFLLLGALGGRLDHALANVGVLLMLDGAGKRAVALDDFSQLEIVSDRALVPDSWPWFSLLAVDGPAEGVTIRNAKYPLEDACIDAAYQYGVSNEPLPGGAEVSMKTGRLLLVKVARDSQQ